MTHEELEALRQHEVQAIGAAISNQGWQRWHPVEVAYNALRDKIDAFLGEERRNKHAKHMAKYRRIQPDYGPTQAGIEEAARILGACHDER